MSLLKTSKRPIEIFDPTNPFHRKWMSDFTINQSWRDCPVQLAVPGYGNTVAIMQHMLLEYYIRQEFDK